MLQKILSIVISYMLIVAPLDAAGVQVDHTTNTSLDTAPNGVPIVEIANPNANGLSHNKFTNYNVSSKGLILNNATTTTVKTQLGGYIYGNKNLTSNAKVILNEVTSTNRSVLEGYTEVAGQKADLVIANPNGITVNGAGFINTSNITLTTGTPVIKNGQISSFNVQGGDISVEGEGLDASQQDSANLYSYYLKLDAAIYAKKLSIQLGKNNIDYKTGQVTSHQDSSDVNLLLDSSALGGMYAQRIFLVGTDKGVGVNLPPQVLASNGDITITNDGTIELQKVTAKNDITVSTANNLDVQDKLTSSNDISLQAKEITNNSLINAANDLTISSNDLTNNKTLFSGNNMYLYTDNTLLNTNGSNILASNNLTIAKDAANNKTSLVKNYQSNIMTLDGSINIFATDLENVTDDPVIKTTHTVSGNTETWTDSIESQSPGSQILSGNNLDLTVDGIVNKYSLISSENDLNLQANTVENNSINLMKKTTVHKSRVISHKHCWTGWGIICSTSYSTVYYDDTSNAVIGTIDSTMQSGGSITGDIGNFSNANIKANQAVPSTTDTSTDTTSTNYKAEAKNKTFTNIYNGTFKQQKYFTATPEQYNNPNETPDKFQQSKIPSLQSGLYDILTVLVPESRLGIVSEDGIGVGEKVVRYSESTTAKNFFENTKYSTKVQSQIQLGDYHSFPKSVEGFSESGQVSKITGGDGIDRLKLEIKGSYKNKDGTFEVIKEPDGTINHRFFKPNGK